MSAFTVCDSPSIDSVSAGQPIHLASIAAIAAGLGVGALTAAVPPASLTLNLVAAGVLAGAARTSSSAR